MSTRAEEAEEPLVSVVVAAYRHGPYIERCLQSIADQTYGRLELIVVDDNSPDGTRRRAAQFLEKNKRRFERTLLLTNTMNRGAHFSLNRGMTNAAGTYISLMNSDDTYAPSRVEALVGEMRRSGRTWGFSRVQTVDEKDKPYFDETLCHHIYWRPMMASRQLPSLSWGLLRYQLTASTGNLVIERALARRIGGFADLKYCHDWDYMLRAVYYDEPAFVDEPLYNYRVHGTNTFRTLADIARRETEYCLRGYFRRVMANRPVNRRAPAPCNWPSTFLDFVDLMGVRSHLDAVYSPYLKHHRTVDWPQR